MLLLSYLNLFLCYYLQTYRNYWIKFKKLLWCVENFEYRILRKQENTKTTK